MTDAERAQFAAQCAQYGIKTSCEGACAGGTDSAPPTLDCPRTGFAPLVPSDGLAAAASADLTGTFKKHVYGRLVIDAPGAVVTAIDIGDDEKHILKNEDGATAGVPASVFSPLNPHNERKFSVPKDEQITVTVRNMTGAAIDAAATLDGVYGTLASK